MMWTKITTLLKSNKHALTIDPTAGMTNLDFLPKQNRSLLSSHPSAQLQRLWLADNPDPRMLATAPVFTDISKQQIQQYVNELGALNKALGHPIKLSFDKPADVSLFDWFVVEKSLLVYQIASKLKDGLVAPIEFKTEQLESIQQSSHTPAWYEVHHSTRAHRVWKGIQHVKECGPLYAALASIGATMGFVGISNVPDRGWIYFAIPLALAVATVCCIERKARHSLFDLHWHAKLSTTWEDVFTCKSIYDYVLLTHMGALLQSKETHTIAGWSPQEMLAYCQDHTKKLPSYVNSADQLPPLRLEFCRINHFVD